jgi:hypothetical protein
MTLHEDSTNEDTLTTLIQNTIPTQGKVKPVFLKKYWWVNIPILLNDIFGIVVCSLWIQKKKNNELFFNGCLLNISIGFIISIYSPYIKYLYILNMAIYISSFFHLLWLKNKYPNTKNESKKIWIIYWLIYNILQLFQCFFYFSMVAKK